MAATTSNRPVVMRAGGIFFVVLATALSTGQAGAAATAGQSGEALSSAEQPTFQITATAGEIYSDNINLAPPGGNKQSTMITELRPNFLLHYDAPRLSVNANYTLTDYYYNRNGGSNSVYHNLQGLAKLTLIPDHFFFNAQTLYGQQVINPASPSGSSPLFQTNNRTNISSSVVTPYWLQDLGSVGTATLGYAYGRVLYENPAIPDTSSNGAYFSLVSPKSNPDWSWKLNYQRQTLEPETGPSIPFESAGAELGRSLTGKTSLIAGGGRETNFLPNGTTDPLGTSFWYGGLRYTGVLNTAELKVGHRFFGRTYAFSWQHQASQLTTNVDYTEGPTNFSQQILNQSGESLIQRPLPQVTVTSLLNREVFIQKRLALGATLTTARSEFQLEGDEAYRDFTTLGETERVVTLHGQWSWHIGPRSTLQPDYQWQRYRFRDNSVTFTTQAQLGYTYLFDPSLSGTLALRHERRNSDTTAEYRVNVILAQISKVF